jgi:putative ABC transport system substrate-binding protein
MSRAQRRQFLSAASALLAAIVGPLTVRAQPPSPHGPYRIAPVPDFRSSGVILKILTDALRQWGRIEGRDYVFYHSGVYYGPDLKLAVDRALAAKPDLIIANNLGSAVWAHKLTKTIPIVMWISGFPVQGGVAESLARPGMNVTGMTIYAGGEFFGKLMQLLLEAKPGVKRVGFFMSYLPPFHPRTEADLIISGIREAAGPLGVDLRIFEIAKSEQVKDALASAVAQDVEALVLTSDFSIWPHREEIGRFAVARRLPTVADFDWNWKDVEHLPLLSYFAPWGALMRQVAPYVERILWEGAKPGDLPIQLPARFKFLVNLKTAKAIGLTVPQTLLFRADQVIE